MDMKNNFADDDALFSSIAGKNDCIKKLHTAISQATLAHPSTILIYGEPGTEKECIAKLIHKGLQSNEDRFIILNCFLLDSSTVKKELVAHINPPSSNRTQPSHKATLLLHKIDRLKAPVQYTLSKLLRTRAEGNRSKNKNVRIIATIDSYTSRPAEETGLCKELDDCFNVCRINVPSLKERREDIPLLLDIISSYYCRKYDQKRIIFTNKVAAILTEYPWRGNTRELKKLVKHLVLNSEGTTIGTKELPIHFHNRTARKQPWSNLRTEIDWNIEQIDFKQLVDQFETELIVTAMQRSGGNKMEAARLLNLKRTTLVEKIKKKGIDNLWRYLLS